MWPLNHVFQSFFTKKRDFLVTWSNKSHFPVICTELVLVCHDTGHSWHITTHKIYTNIAHHITYKHHTSHITTQQCSNIVHRITHKHHTQTSHTNITSKHTKFTQTSDTDHTSTTHHIRHRSYISHIHVWVIWCYLYPYIKQLRQFSAKWFGSNWNR